MIEKRIYNGWAYTENEKEKSEINREIYKELKEKYKILRLCDWDWPFKYPTPTEEELEQNDIVYSKKTCYSCGEYILYKAPENITDNELLLIFDEGNLCFGGRHRNYSPYYYVYED